MMMMMVMVVLVVPERTTSAVESHLYMCTCSCQYICKSIHNRGCNIRGHQNDFTANVLVNGFPLWMCES